MDEQKAPDQRPPIPPALRCDRCKKEAAEWLSIWSKGQPRYTLIADNGRCPENVTKLCERCKDISATRFRP
jgi:hypothetical protein